MRERTLRSDRLLEELGKNIILRDLSRRELRRFAPLCQLREYDPGERVVEQDSVGSDLHLILEGSMGILVRGAERGEVRVSAVGKGEVLGEAAIFMDLPRTASAVADQACLVAAVPRERLFAYCDANPRAGLRIFGFVIYSLLRRLGATSRELALEREAVVRPEDLERMLAFFPRSIEDMLQR